jgi:hypothetical protein
MKHSPLFLLAIISLTLSSCALTSPKDVDCTLPNNSCKENEMCYVKPGGTAGSCIGKFTEEKSVVTPTPEDSNSPEKTPINPIQNPTTPPKNTPKTPENNTETSEEVSTEELTKELDAFVDEITKGL